MSTRLTPGLIVLHGHRMENLRDAVLAWLHHHPLAPLETETFLVSSNSIAEWLKIALAEHGGIFAAARFQLPTRFLWQSYREMLGRAEVPPRSPFDRAALPWRLMRLLPERLAQPEFAPLRHFLGQHDAERRLQLAERLADLYDQYQVYRADWLEDWRDGQDTVRLADTRTRRPLGQEQRWQASLWRVLMADFGDSGLRSSLVDVHRRFLAAIEAGAVPTGRLPRRLVLFGVSTLPRQTLEAFAALARYTQLLLAIPNPCQYHWADIIDGRELLHAERRRQRLRNGQALSAVPLQQLHTHSHPLLASWGRQGRDFVRLLDQFDDVEATQQQYPQLKLDLYDDNPGDTLLQQVQAAIRDLLPLAEHPRRPLADGDRSIVFHIAHSPQREVEVLHNQLLHLLAEAPGVPLCPREILVMVPDIASFTPAIDAVFGQYDNHDPRYIPFEIADVQDRSVSPLLAALDWLLQLPQRRCRQSEVRDLLDVPALATRFGIAAEERPTLARWIDGAGICWGLDQQHRDALTLGETGEQNSWLFGIRRMLLGYATGAATPFAGIEPYAEIAGLDAKLAGSLATLVETLIDWHARLSTEHSPQDWAATARALLHAFFVADAAADEALLIRLDQALQDWLQACDEAGFTEAVPLPVLREAWLGALDQPALDHRFVSGGVTFCTLMPMRAVPFRVVCLLGMNDGDFPRQPPQADFNLLTQPGLPRPGDRSHRDDDRYLMLEALLAARDHLYISWTGRHVRDNTAQPPSVLVAQLRDYLAAGWPLDLGALTTEHPLQPFSRRYFEPDGPLTYAREWQAAHDSQDGTQDTPLPSYSSKEIERLDLGELASFIRQPVKYFFRRRLGVVFDDLNEPSHDEEPFALDGLAQYQLRDALLAPLAEDDAPDAALLQRIVRLAGRGQLPIGGAGRRYQKKLLTELTPMHQAWQALCGTYTSPAEPLRCELALDDTLRLEDWIERLQQGAGRTVWIDSTASKLAEDKKRLRGDPLITPWLRQLGAAAADRSLHGYLIARDGCAELPPLDKQAAINTLQTLLRLWREGMQGPLPTACHTGLSWIRDPNTAARSYDGDGYAGSGEVGKEPSLARLWPDYATLSKEPGWQHITTRLYRPLTEWLETQVCFTPYP